MKFKTLLFILAALVATTTLYAAGKKTRVYVYGFAAAFNDSLVYFTDIQTLDSATIASKSGFLYGRDNYSYQLRDYLKGHGCATPTCITTFSVKRKDIEKKYVSLKKKYANGKYIVKHVTPSEFAYTVISPDEDMDVDMLTKAERKAIKQKHKQEMKEQKSKAKARKREAKHGAPTSAEPLSKNE